MDKFFLHFLISSNFDWRGIFKELFNMKTSKIQEDFRANYRPKLKLNLADGLPIGEVDRKKPRQEPSQNSHLGLITF